MRESRSFDSAGGAGLAQDALPSVADKLSGRDVTRPVSLMLCAWCEDFGVEVRANGQHGGVDLCEYCLRGEWNPARPNEGSKLCKMPGCARRLPADGRESFCFNHRGVGALRNPELRVAVPKGQRRVDAVRRCETEGCAGVIRKGKHTKCKACRNPKAVLRICATDGCGKSVRGHEVHCYTCRLKESRAAAAALAGKCGVCGKQLRADNASGYCYPHRVKPERPMKSCACGCGETLLANNHKYLAGHGPQKAGPPEKKYLKAKRSCEKCGGPINNGNSSGVCSKCQVLMPRRVEPRLCKCGCGTRLTARWAYVKNHGPVEVDDRRKGEEAMAKKLCKCGCGEPAGARWEYKRGHKPKDGTEVKTSAKRPDGGANSPRQRELSGTPASGKGSAVPEPTGGAHVTLAVPVAAVDNWWQGLSAQKRGEIFLAELSR